jgi:hypothetical protein
MASHCGQTKVVVAQLVDLNPSERLSPLNPNPGFHSPSYSRDERPGLHFRHSPKFFGEKTGNFLAKKWQFFTAMLNYCSA